MVGGLNTSEVRPDQNRPGLAREFHGMVDANCWTARDGRENPSGAKTKGGKHRM